MTVVFIITILILLSLLGFLVYRLKMKKEECNIYQKRYNDIKTDRDFLDHTVEIKILEISSLKKELSSLKNREIVPVTRIETYTPEMKVLKYSVELCQSDFGDMPKEKVIEIAKDELYKNIFESIKPFILIIETDDIYRMRTTVAGKIVVSDKGREL
ncbi:MAG: hypothetical protein J6Y02_02220 [Pseudobutyrivibrio sp.]|nr:hypothetical protein [Pseudobutyrivibrio sp.]